jgi:hypothetical protein
LNGRGDHGPQGCIGGAELKPRRPDIAFSVLAGECRAATLTPVGGAPGELG